jgi:putative effector of murein hydrolase
MMGAGAFLMSFLGVVILSFGFRIFGQRRLMKRHAPEIFGATTLSAAFSLFSTAYAGRLMGLAPGDHGRRQLQLLQPL